MKREIKLNPDNKPCTLDDLKKYRDQMQVEPVDTSFGVVDADSESLATMQSVIDNFDAIGNTIDWTLADNTSVTVNRDDLQSMYDQVYQSMTLRKVAIHNAYNKFKNQSTYPLLGDIKNLSFWLTNQS